MASKRILARGCAVVRFKRAMIFSSPSCLIGL
uniref:Uncharacterized protein n=1 Tax=Physcomitrium patens TaxID=3218 RepID=A0A2K1JU31_PHYPA|nr:hypothetical protein PHYPA_014801 [Physcomitrium patens]